MLKRIFGLFVVLLFSTLIFGQIEIADRAALEAISSNLSGSYVLVNDIDLSDKAWTPLGEFKGLLDGNGKIIRGMRFNDNTINSVGFFKTAKNAIIKNIGFEEAQIVGRNQVGIIVGNATGTRFEACYVGNSTVSGNDHVASICGRAQSETLILNCYSTSKVTTNTQSGGLVGVAENAAVTKSYFSGTIAANKRANGIVGLVDKTGDFMEVSYCVNLAPYLSATNVTDLYRVMHDGERAMQLIENYSLQSTLIGAPGFLSWRTSTNSSSLDGKDLSPQDASSQLFYEDILAWDFVNVWQMPQHGYPKLQWQTADPVDITVFTNAVSTVLRPGVEINLNEYLPASHGYNLLDFSTTNPHVTISEEGILSVLPDVEPIAENINISFAAKSGYTIKAVDVTLVEGNPPTFSIPLRIINTQIDAYRKIRVSSFNVRNDNSGDANAGNGWSNRLPVIKDMILFHDMDIIGTQECKSNQIIGLRDSLLRFNYQYIGRGRGQNPTDDEFSAIYYKSDKFTLLDAGDFWLSQTPEKPSKGWDAALNRICSWGKFEDQSTGFQFFAFNLHHDHVGVKARKYSSELVLEKVRQIAGEAPVFLTGDFNVDQTSVGYEILTDPAACLFKDSYLLAPVVHDPTGTFNAFNINNITSQRIDHVFITDHFKVSRYGVLTDIYWTDPSGNPTNPGNFPAEVQVQEATPRLPSDHYPILVELYY